MQALPAPATKRANLRNTPKPLALPIEDACAVTGLGKTKIYELIAEGKLKAVSVGRRRLVHFSSIEALLQSD